MKQNFTTILLALITCILLSSCGQNEVLLEKEAEDQKINEAKSFFENEIKPSIKNSPAGRTEKNRRNIRKNLEWAKAPTSPRLQRGFMRTAFVMRH